MSDAVDRIEVIRSHNNRFWMAILKVALESDPDATKALLQEVIKQDRLVIQQMEAIVADD